MDGGAADLNRHLLKIPATATEESVACVLETLWNTRNTGLSPLQKHDLQSRLGLSSSRELDPVLVSLRSILRKAGRQNLPREDIQKLFPPSCPQELQSILLALLERYQSEWNEQSSREQTRVSQQARVASLWPREDDAAFCSDNGEPELPITASLPLHADSGFSSVEGDIPCLTSMTWTVENRNSAVVCLKLQDYAKSPSGEVEVKFQLSRDTLEAMLRSMTYINDQLSKSG